MYFTACMGCAADVHIWCIAVVNVDVQQLQLLMHSHTCIYKSISACASSSFVWPYVAFLLLLSVRFNKIIGAQHTEQHA
jgi:hypothetical protein